MIQKLFSGILVVAFAAATLIATPAHAEAGATPDYLIRDAVKAFKKNLRHLRGKSIEERQALARKHIDEHVTPNTDFRLMAERIFADHWAEIEAQGLVDEAVEKVRSIYLRIQVNALANYSNQRIRVFTADVEGEFARVHMKVDAFKTFTIDVYLQLREDGHWKIYDMAVIGASFVDAMKRGFGIIIAKRGLDGALQDESFRMEGET